MSEEKRERIRKILGKYADMKPEDGETWESWYVAANDLMGQEIGIALEVADAAQPVARVPEDEADGYLVVSVKGLQELDTALDRADFKGYLPEDIAQAWYNLDWRSVAPQAPAVRVDLCDLRRRIAAAPRRQFESEKGVYTSWLDQGAVLDLLDAHIEKALAVIGFDRAQDGSECTVYGYVKEGVLHVDRIEQAPAVSERELAERDEDAYVIERLSTILADVAIALKGPEIPRHRHSYHDLVEVAQTLKLEVDLYRSCAVSHPTALAEGGELVTWKCNCCTHEFSAGMERPACPNCKAGDQYTYRVSCPRCRGMNCGATDGVSHSLECQAEHAAAIAGGRFVKDAAARDAQADDKKPIREPGYDIHGDRLG
jgi:hypothetical protein